jgi:hypothetical protein
MHDRVSSNERTNFKACLQLEMQMRTNALVMQVREEHRVSIVRHTDALVGLADDIEHVKDLLSRALRHSQLYHSSMQDARVSSQGSDSPLQSTVRSLLAISIGQSTHNWTVFQGEKPQSIDEDSSVLRFVLRTKIIQLKYVLRNDAVFSNRPRARLDAGSSPEGGSSELMDDALATVLLLLNNLRPNHSTSPTKLMIELRRLTQQLIDLQLHTDALEFHSIALCRLEALAHCSPTQVAYDMPLALATQALLLGLSGRNDDAREAIRRAIAFAERLSGDNGKATTAICFNVMAWVDDYSLETAAYLEWAIAIYWHLMARYPSRYLVKYLENLSLLGHVMLNAGDPLRAIAVLKHALLFWQHLDRPHHQPIRERILTRLNKALRSAGKSHTAGAVVPYAKYMGTSGDGRGGVCRWKRRLLVCCRRKRTSISPTGDSHSRFCRGISSVLDKIRAMRLANTTLPGDVHGAHSSIQSMQNANAPFRNNGKSDSYYHSSPSTDHPSQ